MAPKDFRRVRAGEKQELRVVRIANDTGPSRAHLKTLILAFSRRRGVVQYSYSSREGGRIPTLTAEGREGER